ncbi:unnamed protein product, partial [Rotaria sp. Silwood2]
SLGNYGLISIDAWESNKTIVKSISQDEKIRNSVREQCLQYYYYFTVYDKLDWGQQISVLIKSENETDDENEIDRLSVVDILENRWHPRNITFNSTYANYTLMFHFEVTNDNRTNDPTLNKTIYFALDNIELYNRNCRNLIEPATISTTTSTITSQSPTTTAITASTTDESTDNRPVTSNNLGLILGLSLGLGIPAVAASIGGIVYYLKIAKPKSKVIVQNSNATTEIPMTPTMSSTNRDTTVTV